MNARAAALIVIAGTVAAVGTTACEQQPTVSPSAVSQNATVTGLVWLHDAGGVKPYTNAQVSAWVQSRIEGGGGVSGQRTAPINSGPDGRYSFTVPTGAQVRVHIDSPAAYQPCVTATTAAGTTNLDVHAIVDPAKLGGHLPGELLVDTRTLSGTVFETTALGRQPVPGVYVTLDMFSGLGDVSARTLTDSDGRYVLCGLGDGAATAPSLAPYVYASKNGYRLADVGTVLLNGNTIQDIELQR